MATVQASVTQFQVEEKAEGEYKVEQVVPQDSGPSLHSGNRQEINFEAGPIKITGYYDPDSREIGAYPSFGGMKIGDGYYASLDKGIQIQCVLVLYNGGIKFFRSGNKLRVEVHLSPVLPWGSDINEGADLFDI